MRKIFSRLWRDSLGYRKRNIFLFSLTLAWFFCPFPAQAEVLQPKSSDTLNVWLDYACFRNLGIEGQPDTVKSYVEIYYSFNRKQLKFSQEKEAYQAKIFLNLTIADTLGNLVENRMWNSGAKVDHWEETQVDYMILDKAEVILEPGDYVLKLSVTDLGSESQGEASLELRAKAFGEKNLQLSDLELAFQIEPDTSSSKFTKSGRKILPNPSGVFTHHMGMIYFYAELYNLVTLPTVDSDYVLGFTVLDSTGKVVKDFGAQTRKKPGNSAVVLSGINISTLPGGGYVLGVETEDKETGQKAKANKKFIILGAGEKRDEGIESSEEVEGFKQDVAYIATAQDLHLFDQLNLEGKKRFIEEFWKKRDPLPIRPLTNSKLSTLDG